jgi:hypothetical protein
MGVAPAPFHEEHHMQPTPTGKPVRRPRKGNAAKGSTGRQTGAGSSTAKTTGKGDKGQMADKNK